MSESMEEHAVVAERGATSARVGALFTQAREQAGMSIEDAARQLRLSPRQVRALEADDTAALPDATFVRGFIRNYARLLQIDAEPLLQAYRTCAPSFAQHTIALHSENIPIVGGDRKGWMPYAVASLAIGLALGGWMIYMDYQADHPTRTAPVAKPVEKALEPQPAPPPVPSEPEAVVPQPEATAIPAPVAAPVAAAVSPVPQAQNAAPLSVAPATHTPRLKLTFSDQVWMSVVDRDGKEIYNKTTPAGGEEVVAGVPPLKVVIGNAAGVQVSYNDKPVDLALHTKANIARFTLE